MRWINRVGPDAMTAPLGQSQTLQHDNRPALPIAFFAHDSSESTAIKRARAFQANGARVIGSMFRRRRAKPARLPTWENIELGITVDRHYLSRIPKLLAAIPKLLRYHETLRDCSVFYARNIDMLLLAVLTKLLLHARAIVVYEVLDVQRVFTGTSLVSRTMRWAERRLLSQCVLIVVSSPEFISRYFEPIQGYRGPWQLLENKICSDQIPKARRKFPTEMREPPWLIGWFGAIRCKRSIVILSEIADRLNERVEIHIRGLPHDDKIKTQIVDAVRRHPNIYYHGPYKSPDDLEDIYGKVHFSWCVDFSDAGANSDWLLPNRLYEGCLYNSIALDRKGTATSRMIEQHHLGWSFVEPLAMTISNFLSSVDVATYARTKKAIQGKERSLFIDENDTAGLIKRMEKLSGIAKPAFIEWPK